MSDITLTTNTPATPIPVAALLPWALFTTLLALLAIYFVGAELSGLKKVWPLIHTNTARRLTAVKKRCLAVKPSPGSG